MTNGTEMLGSSPISSSGQENLPLKHVPPSYGTGDSAEPMIRKGSVRVLDTALIVVVPWVIFSLLVCTVAFAMEDYAPLVWALAAACAVLSVLFIAMGIAAGVASHVAVGFLTLVSVIIGVLVGLTLQHGYMDEYWQVDNGAIYRNLDPVEAASSHADGTQLYFAKGSSIDTQRSIGYMRRGEVYCVAPIIGPRVSSTVEYWAVGKNCCDRRGGFACGVVNEAAALDGVVVTADVDYYRNAARMAQSVYRLVPPKGIGGPIFVERTTDIPGHMRSLWWNAMSLTLVASGIHLAVSCGAGFILARSLK